MLLENKFYKVLSENRTDAFTSEYCLSILPECTVYDGHFPGDPVCPGVCNIETIKECAMLLTGESLRYNSIKQCRLTALATPTVCPELKVQLNLSPSETGYGIQATISDKNQVYMILKGQLDKQ